MSENGVQLKKKGFDLRTASGGCGDQEPGLLNLSAPFGAHPWAILFLLEFLKMGNGFLCVGPKGSKFENVRVRFFAQKLKSEPDKLKVVIQAIENEVIAEDPIYQGFNTELEVELFVEQSRNEGWFVFPWEGKFYV